MRFHTFSDNYQEARERFVQACENAGAELSSFLFDHVKGPDGKDLYIDAARFGPKNAANVLLCACGTHGAERFPGSAVQIDWIGRLGKHYVDRDGDTAVWMIHAVNPFGFAWQFRGNENHVDLNRNWIDYGDPLPTNPAFEDLSPLLESYLKSDEEHDRVWQELKHLEHEHGAAWVENTLTKGQFRRSELMSFGGREPQHSRKIVTKIIDDNLQDAERVAYVDLHSGTMGIGELIFLCFSPLQSREFARAGEWWGKENLDPVRVAEKWGGARPDRHGLMFWGLDEHLGPDVSFAGAVVEFGTLAPKDIDMYLKALLSESWLRRDDNYFQSENEKHIQICRWASDRPGDTSWEKAVIEKGKWVMDRAEAGLAAWSKE